MQGSINSRFFEFTTDLVAPMIPSNRPEPYTGYILMSPTSDLHDRQRGLHFKAGSLIAAPYAFFRKYGNSVFTSPQLELQKTNPSKTKDIKCLYVKLIGDRKQIEYKDDRKVAKIKLNSEGKYIDTRIKLIEAWEVEEIEETKKNRMLGKQTPMERFLNDATDRNNKAFENISVQMEQISKSIDTLNKALLSLLKTKG